jgi:hypothetical protein
MSVMACDRMHCQHVMCERLILDRSAYICDDCFDELVEWRKTWPDEMRASEIAQRIRVFMAQPLNEHRVLNKDGIEEEFRRLTGQNER